MSDETPTAALARYLGDALDVNALASILEAETWDGPSPVAANALRLIYEFGNGDWTERQLRDRLHRLIEPRPTGFVFGIAFIKPRFTEQPGGVPIRHPSIAPGQPLQPTEESRSEPHSGIGIGERRPVQVQ